MKKTTFFSLFVCLLAILGIGWQAQAADTTTPAAITNLASGTITQTSIILTWTAPGDDDMTGTSTAYDLRYNTSTITSANWADSIQIAGEPTPQTAGSAETKTVTGLLSDTVCYFAIKSKDEVDNWSGLSNIISAKTLVASDGTAPIAISNLSVSTTTASSVTLIWTAPGDDGSTGTAGFYDIRYSLSNISNDNWASAFQATGEPSPKLAGGSETMIVTGLSANTTYYFAIKAKDEANNISGLSNVVLTKTKESIIPLPGTDLTVDIAISPQSINLKSQGNWISVRVFLPAPYKASDIDINSIKLNSTLSPDAKYKGLNYFRATDIGKEKFTSNLILKFSRSEVIKLIGSNTGTFDLVLTGKVKDKTFSGKDTINILSGLSFKTDNDNDDNDNNASSTSRIIVKIVGDDKVYIIINNKFRRHIPNPEAFKKLNLKWEDIKTITKAELESFIDDILLKAGDDPRVYLISGGTKRHIISPEVFNSYGFDWKDISVVSKDELANYLDANLVREANNEKVYFILNGKKHWVKTLAAFNKRGFKWDSVAIVNSAECNAIQTGEDLD